MRVPQVREANLGLFASLPRFLAPDKKPSLVFRFDRRKFA